ncbi:serine/threonine-protein phosphatase CPPED1 isoform X1 [Lepisosteus oculatus]|uniref:serine/threonine-protein phosphatase CPPED1 isoform X1 n=2 Tax=Lepisosteus oculatus TaxID=7918 RepID=UPI0035F51493
MASDQDIFLRAKNRTYAGFTQEEQGEWKGPFCFIQAADPQLGLMKAWSVGDCDGGGDEWSEEVRLTRQAARAVSGLSPRPRFMVVCGDLVHAMPGAPWRDEQERDLKAALREMDPAIPLVFVSGNHDLGNTPTPEAVAQYRRSWGDDYFSFWVGGVLCLVLNSQLFFDGTACPGLRDAQDAWLAGQLEQARRAAPRHVLVFQHIPLFLRSPAEEHDYFNLQREVREALLQRFAQAGVKAVFSGHYHRNAGGVHGGLDMVVTSAIGCQLGTDPHGVRVVVVTEEQVVHRYYSLEQLSEKGLEPDLRQLLA